MQLRLRSAAQRVLSAMAALRRPASSVRLFAVGVALALSLHYAFRVLSGTRPRAAGAPECDAKLSLVGDGASAAWAAGLGGGGADAGGCRCRSPPVYRRGKAPRLTAIVQSFNHRGNVGNISAALKGSRVVEEVVICEDGSSDGSMHEWKAALPGLQDFVIRSNNLHELRSYNRAMRMSGGDIVCLLQDDDLLPASGQWLEDAMKIFAAKPELGLLGGYIGQLWEPDTGKGYEYGEQRSTHGGLRMGNTEPIQYVDEATGLPFMYAECVWIAPVFARRSLLEKAGGLDLAIAKRGEPGVWQDCVFSYEAWVNGFTVGVFGAEFGRGVGGHGSATSAEKIKQRGRVWERAVAYSNRHYNRPKIHDYVVRLNNETLAKRKGV